jgi:hypothetical protein
MTPLIPPHVTLQELETQKEKVDQMVVGEVLEPVRQRLSGLIEKHIAEIKARISPKQNDNR